MKEVLRPILISMILLKVSRNVGRYTRLKCDDRFSLKVLKSDEGVER